VSQRPRKTVDDARAYIDQRLELDSTHGERGVLDLEWFASIAYFIGRQDIQLTAGGQIARRLGRSDFVANKFFPAIERAVAKIRSADLSFAAVPRSDSLSDARSARVARDLFDQLRGTRRFRMVDTNVERWSALTGTGIYKIHWDPSAGKPRRRYYSEDPGQNNRVWLDEEQVDQVEGLRNHLESLGQFEDVGQGDIVIDSVSPFTFRVDPQARLDLDEAEWVAQEQYELVSTAAARYGLKESEIDTSEGADGSERYRRITRVLSSESTLMGTGGNDKRRGRFCRVVEFWERPMRSNRHKGRRIVLVGNKAVVNGENPYAALGTTFPYVVRRYSIVPDRFWGHGLGQLLRQPQRSYNRSRGAGMDYQERHAFPVTYIPKGSSVREAQLKTFPGICIEYNSAIGPPVFAPQPAMPPQIMQNAEAANAELQELSAQAAPQADGLPGQLRSGAAVSLVQQSNTLILAPTLEDRGEALAEVGRQFLRLAQKQYTRPRRVRRVSEKTGSFEFSAFVGADLSGTDDVVVVARAGEGPSHEEQRAVMLDLVQLGVMNPQDAEDKAEILKMYRLGEARVIDRKSSHRDLQEFELEKMLQDPEWMPQVSPWQNHEEHALVLEQFMNQPGFYDMPEWARMAVANHWQEHTQALNQQIQAAMMLQANQKEKGTPSRARQQSVVSQ
jgi:hypothetical protein